MLKACPSMGDSAVVEGGGDHRVLDEAVRCTRSTTMAGGRRVWTYPAFLRSRANDVPFYAVARLLRAASGVSDLDASADRTQVQAGCPTPMRKLMLFEDLLGIADPEASCRVDPDARRRRSAACVAAASLARRARPSMSLRTCAGSTRSANPCSPVSGCDAADTLLVLIACRPEYRGALSGARCPKHGPCAAERFGDRSTRRRSAGARLLGRRV